MTDPTSVAERLKAHARLEGKPILACWMGGPTVEVGRAILSAAGIPTFDYPDTAVRAFDYMRRYAQNLRGLYETPVLAGDPLGSAALQAKAQAAIEQARKRGRTLLTEAESKQILELYGIPTVQTRVARSDTEAVKLAGEIGYPVVLKLHSETIAHKSDIGGVKLNLRDDESVQNAYRAMEISVAEKTGPGNFLGVTVQPMVTTEGYELILGSSVDSQLGPVLLFGSGGELVDVYRDNALALPPLTTTLAERAMEQTRILIALKGVRGRPPVDLQGLASLLVRFSQLVLEQRWIKEIDINPLLASPDRLLALDARMVLYGPEVTGEQLPRPGIRPYPAQYVSAWTMKDGTSLTLRPIRPEDEPLIVKFHQTLSERPRYFQQMKVSLPVAHERLIGICFPDYDREIALVAYYKDPKTGASSIVAVARLRKIPWSGEAEMALVVSDELQNRGLGSELIRQLLAIGRQEGVLQISAEFLVENATMQHLCQKLGFRLERGTDESLTRAVIDLAAKDHSKALQAS
jgi:acetyltransferase